MQFNERQKQIRDCQFHTHSLLVSLAIDGSFLFLFSLFVHSFYYSVTNDCECAKRALCVTFSLRFYLNNAMENENMKIKCFERAKLFDLCLFEMESQFVWMSSFFRLFREKISSYFAKESKTKWSFFVFSQRQSQRQWRKHENWFFAMTTMTKDSSESALRIHSPRLERSQLKKRDRNAKRKKEMKEITF